MSRIRIKNNAIIIDVLVNGTFVIPMILDTGDAIGPVFNREVASVLQLQPTGEIGVSGAGGATTNYATVATIEIDEEVWTNEPAAIDENLQGLSLIGLPFFLKYCSKLELDFQGNTVTLER